MKMKILKNNNDVLQNTTTEEQRFLSINGGTLIGPLILQGNPNLPLEAATRQYVDTLIALRAPLAHTHTLSNITDYPPHVTPALLNNLVGTTGNILLHLNNPNHTTTFRLPDREDLEYTETKLNYYIKT